VNRYSKALKQLKSTKIDSKIKKLEESPTNNTKGVYSLNPQGYRLGKPEPPTQFFPKDDGTYPDGVPGTDGEAVYTRPGGFWDGGKNWESTMSYDANQDNIGDDGKNTDGLIGSDGTVKTFLPDGSRGFILGPLTDGFVLDHTTDAYTNIGYLQKDTRQFVLLGKITGQWKSGIYSDSADVPVWGGTSTGFTAHNENFTLAMAQWMRTQILADNYYSNLPYFYSGGVPQGGIADCPTCLPGMKGGNLVGGGGDGSSLSGDGKGTGQTGKGSGDDVTTGDEHTQGDPTHGDQEDAGGPFPGLGDLAWGKPKEPPSPENKQGRGMHINIINYYNSGMCCFPIPAGWTNDDVRRYVENDSKGFPNQSSSGGFGSGEQVAGYSGSLDNWIDKTYGSGASNWYRENPGLPSERNPFIPSGSYVPKAQKKPNSNTYTAHYEPQGKVLSESTRTKILREIKKPFEVPELPKKYKMNFKGKFTPQNTPDKTASKESDGLAAVANMRGQKWSQDDKYWAGYETTETMNVVYDKVGHGEQAWNRMIEGARQKNGWKNREIIEQLNIIAHEKASRKVNPDYQSPWVIQEASPEQVEKEKNFDNVNKIKQIIGNTKRGDIKPEYPDKPAVELGPDGYHPNYGKKYKHDKLDPDSAEAMPDTGNPEIDANVKKVSDVKRKARKLKTLLGKMR